LAIDNRYDFHALPRFLAAKALALLSENARRGPVRQVPWAYAKALRQAHKNDFRDAYAIAEAARRPSTRCVPTKTDDQLDLQALHRVRSRLISGPTAVIHQIRGFLLERGIAIRQGLRFLRQQLPEILAKRIDVLSPPMIRIIEDLSGD
jgi:transposase